MPPTKRRSRVERAAGAEQRQKQSVGLDRCRAETSRSCRSPPGHGGAPDGGRVDFQVGDAGGVELAVGGGDGTAQGIGVEQLLAQLLDQPVGHAPALVEGSGVCPDLVGKCCDVDAVFALRGGTALVRRLTGFFQQRNDGVGLGERNARRRQVATAEHRTTLGLFQFQFAGGSSFEVAVEQGDDGSKIGSRPRPAESFGMREWGHRAGSFFWE